MIDTSVIDAIKDLDIIEVIRPYVGKITRTGSSYKTCCPFHNEKTPSFNIKPSKGIYKCFGCGEGGDAISFVMKKEGLSFNEAVEQICNTHKIRYEKDEKTQSDPLYIKRQRQLYIINKASEYFEKQYEGSIAETRSNERGFSSEISKCFRFGYALDGFDNLLSYLKSIEVTEEEMIECSLIKAGTASKYDFFRNRLMFPICDHMGKVIGFSGRAVKEGQMPKYINTAETDLYHKSKNLYGLHLAKTFMSKENECIVVEGATDVITMHQLGFKNTVGTLGTALTADHAKIIKKYTDNVLLMYDGDTAGLKAVFRACEPLFTAGLFVNICRLPEGEDPDVYVKKVGYEGFKKYIELNKKDWISFRISLLSQSISDKVIVAKELKAMIEKHPDREAREIMMYEYSKKFGILYEKTLKRAENNSSVKIDASPEYNLLRICFLYGTDEVLEYFAEDENNSREYLLKGFVNEDYKKVAEAIFLHKIIDVSSLLHSEDLALKSACMKVMNMGAVQEEDEDWDITYSILRFEYHTIDIFEKELRRSDDLNAIKRLKSMSGSKKKLKKEIENLLNEKKIATSN